MALEKRGKNWFYYFVVNGVRYRGPLKTTHYQEARRREHDEREKAKAGKLAADKRTKSLARLIFSEAAERYIADRAPDLAPKTVTIERERHQSGTELQQLGFVAGLGHRRLVYVVGDVEVGVIHPHRCGLAEQRESDDLSQLRH